MVFSAVFAVSAVKGIDLPERLRRGIETMNIPLSNPDITERERRYVDQVFRTPDLSLGPKLPEFEEKVANYVGTKYAVAVNSGTSGLHLCVKSLGIGEGDEVITTPFSFIASANSILFERAKPVFVDIDRKTLNLDVGEIEGKITDRTKAILPVHVFGQPCEMDSIVEIARKYNLWVIEDACEAIGAEYKSEKSKVKSEKLKYESNHQSPITNHQPPSTEHRAPITKYQKVGTCGDCGVFAFYPNKQITTGEGGMIVTDDEGVAQLCRSLRNQGRGEESAWLAHERLGYNYRISDINCALGIAQLERIDDILAQRQSVAEMYNERLKDVDGIEIPYLSPNVKMSWFVYVVRLEDGFTKEHRDGILRALRAKGIGCSNYFPPIHLQPFYVQMFGYKRGDFPITESVSERTIALPFYNNLREEEVDYVVEVLKREVRNRRKRA